MIGQVEQIANVVEGVIELGRGERPTPPVGARLAAAEADAQDLPDQVDQRERITEARPVPRRSGRRRPAGAASRSRSRQIRRSSPAACITTSTAGSKTTSQKGSGRERPAGRSPPAARASRPGSGRGPARRSLRRQTRCRRRTGRSPADDRPALGAAAVVMSDSPSMHRGHGSADHPSRCTVAPRGFQCSRLFRNRRITALATAWVFVGSHVAGLGITSSRASGIASAIALASAGGVITSSSPTRTRVGPRSWAGRRGGRAGSPCRAAPRRYPAAPFAPSRSRIGSTRSGRCSRVILAEERGSIDSTTGPALPAARTAWAVASRPLGRLGRVGPGAGIHQHQARTRSG